MDNLKLEVLYQLNNFDHDADGFPFLFTRRGPKTYNVYIFAAILDSMKMEIRFQEVYGFNEPYGFRVKLLSPCCGKTYLKHFNHERDGYCSHCNASLPFIRMRDLTHLATDGPDSQWMIEPVQTWFEKSGEDNVLSAALKAYDLVTYLTTVFSSRAYASMADELESSNVQ